jgi:hypothetical protein
MQNSRGHGSREYLRSRSCKTARPKEEWDYLNFVQRFGKKSLLIDRNELASEWKEQRAAQAALAQRILGDFKRGAK